MAISSASKNRALSGGAAINSASSSPSGTTQDARHNIRGAKSPKNTSRKTHSRTNSGTNRPNMTSAATEHKVVVSSNNSHNNGLLKPRDNQLKLTTPRSHTPGIEKNNYPKSPASGRRQTSPNHNYRNTQSANKSKLKKTPHWLIINLMQCWKFFAPKNYKSQKMLSLFFIWLVGLTDKLNNTL